MKEKLSFKTLKLFDGTLEFHKEQIIAHSPDPRLIIEPQLVGVCRSDIKEFLGTRTIRHDFGHEILGKVISSNRSELPSVGDLVVLDPHIKIQRTSGFGELIVATADTDHLLKAFIPVPLSVLRDRLVFVEPLACAHHCVSNLLRFKNQQRLDGLSVGIVGAGMTGILIGLLCEHYGAEASIINRSPERLTFLESTSLFNKENLYLGEADKKFDIVIPTTTFLFSEVLRLCREIVKENGLILLYGGTKKGDTFLESNIDIDQIRRNQESQYFLNEAKSFMLCGTHGAVTQDFKTVIELLSEPGVSLPVEKLISRRIPLEDVPSTITAMSQEEYLGKTVVVIN